MNVSSLSSVSSVSAAMYPVAGKSRPDAGSDTPVAAPDLAQGGAVDAQKRSGDTKPPGEAKKSGSGTQAQPGELSKAELEQVRQLQQRDREVRQHEMAHLAASGGLATSGATYSFQRGPDGIAYAVGGEVRINLSAGRTPQETIARAETIAAAALAPAEPSAQDRAVAAQARQMEQQAMAEEMRMQSQKVIDTMQRKHAGIDKYLEVAGITSKSGSSAPSTSSAGAIDVTA